VNLFAQPRVDVSAGAVHLPSWIPLATQLSVLGEIRRLADSEAGFYTPVLRNGARMRLRMLCCGRHWDAKRYRYESLRTDVDGLAAPPIPELLVELARSAAAAAGYSIEPDVLLVNWYGAEGRLGLHQDKDERPETIESGVPIVSLSIGDSALFEFGGPRRRDPVERFWLESGDAFVFGGASRLNHHGIARLAPSTGPVALGIPGRYNLTFRQY
jgi:alkylated DNA repair protein (DNA oxidative demethylase)